jgi:hypothetical protein
MQTLYKLMSLPACAARLATTPAAWPMIMNCGSILRVLIPTWLALGAATTSRLETSDFLGSVTHLTDRRTRGPHCEVTRVCTVCVLLGGLSIHRHPSL